MVHCVFSSRVCVSTELARGGEQGERAHNSQRGVSQSGLGHQRSVQRLQ